LIQYISDLRCGKLGAVFLDQIAVDAVKVALVGQVKVAGQGDLALGCLFHQMLE
jgi:hypothetical protein